MVLLKDKVAIITGANSGVGAAAARLFSSEGAKVVICEMCIRDRGEEDAGARKSGSGYH